MLGCFAYPVWLWTRKSDGSKARYFSGGALFEGVAALRRKAGLLGSFRVYVIPDVFRDDPAPFRSSAGQRVVVPQRLLDWMSRAEIDALLAFDMERIERKRPLFWVYMAAVAGCVLAVSVALSFLHVGSQGRWAVFLLLLLAEWIALWSIGAGQIKTAGDPETFCSAMVELTRMDGGVVTARTARRIGRMVGISPERVVALQGQARPALDRYPSCGGEENAWY